LSRKLTQPIKKLQKATIQVIKKNYDISLIPFGPNENKTIAKNFNAMVRSLKLSEELSKKHLKELEKIDTQKGEFAAMASHELKTPLVPMKGYLEMLMEHGLVGELNPKQESLLEKIYENTELLEKLILKILTAQRLGLGQMKWNLSEFDVEDLMNNVIADNESLMKDKKIKFTNHCKTNQIIYSDYTQIIQIFSNLIRNSVDFVNDNPSIEISAENKDDKILFYVKDNGIGMTLDAQQHLFKKFYQVDTSVRRKHGGTGLGLSICKGLVDGMGGKIWVESEPNKGSTFYFTIPKDQSKLK
jgi:signal transduction histidine kinase